MTVKVDPRALMDPSGVIHLSVKRLFPTTVCEIETGENGYYCDVRYGSGELSWVNAAFITCLTCMARSVNPDAQ